MDSGTVFAFGFLLGVAFMKGLTAWSATWRDCCRAHYQTHDTCECRSCSDERAARMHL